MKMKMLKFFQGRFAEEDIPALVEGQEYDVKDFSEEFVHWLVFNRFAELKTDPVKKEPNPDPEKVSVFEENSIMTSKNDWNPNFKPEVTAAAKKLAKKENINLDLIEGSGSGGKIILSDVEGFLEEGE